MIDINVGNIEREKTINYLITLAAYLAYMHASW